MNHHPRRVHSPSFGYDPRAIPGDNESGPNYDNELYDPPFDDRPPLSSAGSHHRAFMDETQQHQNYRDQHRLPSAYRAQIAQREPYLTQVPPLPLPRASSPPYKILCITNINHKVGDGQVKEALTNDFIRFGDISVSICHDSGERLAYIYFRNYEEAREARHVKTRTLFFDRPIEIEPIYEPRGGAEVSPFESSPPMAPNSGPIYSPRRRSMTPPEYINEMNNATIVQRNQIPNQIQHPSGHPPVQHLPHHRGMTPPEFHHHSGGFHQGLSPQPIQVGPDPYSRRSAYGGPPYGGPYPPVHIAAHPHLSPYSSPPHEQYNRAPYPPQHNFNQPGLAQFPDNSPYSGSSYHPESRADRVPFESGRISSRSSRIDTYYPSDQRGTFPAPMRNSSSSHYPPHLPGNVQKFNHSHPPPVANYRSPPNQAPRQQNQKNHSDHPPRFRGREYKREKFGGDPFNNEHDDGRPSRVLLVNNIDSIKTEPDLREAFAPFGVIEDIEVKKVAPEVSSALIKFTSMDGAYKAKTAISGRHIGSMRCRIVYGKVSASRRLWIGGLSPATTTLCLEDECSKFGDIVSMDYTSGRPYAYIEYETANQAQFAAFHLRAVLKPAAERKIRIEFVDPDRSEKLILRHDSAQASSASSKSRTLNESWSVNESDTSPLSVGRKRSVTPTETTGSKRLAATGSPVCPNIFRQERLAAAAAKARTSSATSSTASHHQVDSEKPHHIPEDRNEMNNNSDDNQSGYGNLQGKLISNSQDGSKTPSTEVLSHCTSISGIVQSCTTSWRSKITLRNFTFPSEIFLCSGQRQLIDKFISNSVDNKDGDCPVLHITQRWRLHPQPKLEEVSRRMQSGNLGMLIVAARPDIRAQNQPEQQKTHAEFQTPTKQVDNASTNSCLDEQKQNGAIIKTPAGDTPHSLDRSDAGALTESSDSASAADTGTPADTSNNSPSQATQSRPLRNLISYLEQKDAAGVILLNVSDGDHQSATSDGNSKLLYVFPPCDFAFNLLRRNASNLDSSALKEEFLLGVIVGSNETKV